MRVPQIDVLIRGAGPVGCALGLALRGSGLRVSVLAHDREHAGSRAFRPIALSYASRLILERIGAWDGLEPTPIETVQVSQAGGFGRTRLEAAECGVPALGYVVDYGALSETLQTRLDEGVRVKEGASARCVVHAEGISEDAVEKRYLQHAVVGVARFSRPSGTTAHERFTPGGPLALLPHAGSYAFVWSMPPALALELAQVDSERFLAELSATAGVRVGKPLAVEARAVQPLVMRVRPARVAERAVYIGNAAQTLHPVAGQGLNLGLRDAWDLAQILRRASDPGAPRVLSSYGAARRVDAAATIRITDALAGGFLGFGRAPRLARGIALTALDVLPLPRRFFARRMVFGPSAQP